MNTKTLCTQTLFCVRSWRSCLQLLVALVLLGWGATAKAQNSDVWTNGAGNQTWSVTNNWIVNGNPALGLTNNGGDNLTFGPMIAGPNATYRSTNDFTAGLVTIGLMTFNTNGYFIGGNALFITNGITDNFGSNNISLAFTLLNSQTFQNTAVASTNLVTTIVQPVSFGPSNTTLTIAGSGDLYIKGTGSSASVLNSGTNGGGMLYVNNSGVFMMGPGNSSIQNGFGSNWVTATILSTNSYTTVTNALFYTNTFVLVTNGVSTNVFLTIFSNSFASQVITNYTGGSQYVLVTNSNFHVQDAVRVDAGTVQLFNSLSIPNGALVGNVSLDANMDLNGFSPTMNGLEDQGSPNGVIDVVAPTLTGVYTLTVGNASSNGVYNGTIKNTSGTLQLTKTGYGVQVLNNGTSYSGQTTISQGTLMLSNNAGLFTAGSLGSGSSILQIESGGVFDISALNPYNGYIPTGNLTVNAGTPTKPYTNFYGSYFPYNPATPNFVVSITGSNYVNTVVTNITVTGGVPATNIVFTTNYVSTIFSTNSIVNIINYDVIGDFNVNGGGAISPITSIAPGIATWSILGDLSIDSSRTLPTVNPNRVNFLLSTNTTPGGGTNDFINVTGTLYIGDELDVAITPLFGSLNSIGGQKYTLFHASFGYTANGNPLYGYNNAANIIPIAPRGITATITSDANNIYLAASGTASPGNIIWHGTPSLNNWDVKQTQNWVTNAPSHLADYYYAGDNVTFDDTGVGSINLPVVQAPGSVTFNNNATNYTFVATSSKFITGPGGLTLNGPGQVTLNNPNSFRGDVTLNNGTLICASYGGGNNAVLYNNVAPGKLVFGNLGTLENFLVNWNTVSQSTLLFFSGFTLNSGANGFLGTYLPRGATDNVRIIFGDQITRNIGSTIDFTIGPGSANTAGIYFTNSIPWSNGIMFGGYGHNGTDWIQGQTNYPTGPVTSYSYTGYSNNVPQVNWLSTNNMQLSNTIFTLTAPGATINTLKFTAAGSTLTLNTGTTLTNVTGGVLISSGATGPNTIQGGTIMGAAGQDLVLIQNYTVSPLYIGSVIADNGSATALTLGGLGGSVIITNTATYTGATYINNGTLQIGNGGSLGSIATSSAIFDDSALVYNLSIPTTQGTLSGYGALTQAGTGALTLTADNSLLTGPVTVNSGILQLGNGGTAGSISNAASLVDNATVVFNQSGATGKPGPISGSGDVVNAGAGTLFIATNETYSGNTILSNGVVVVTSSGSISNTAAIIVNSGATFNVSAVSGAVLNLRGAVPGEILAGVGSINGSVTTSGGASIMPGTNGVVGNLTITNNLTLNGGNLFFDVGTNGNDHIYVGGQLSQTVGLVNVLLVNTLTNGVYNLVRATNGLVGSAANLAVYVPGIPLGTLAVLTNSTANTLDLLVYSGFSTALFWQGDGTQNYWNASANSIWKDSSHVTQQYANADLVTFDDFGSNNIPVSLNGGSVFPSSVVVNSTNENYTIGDGGAPNAANVIGGGASLTKNGPGTLTLQSVNTYVGPTVINSGTVQLNGAGTASSADGMIGANNNVTNNGILIANNAASETLSGNLVGSGKLVQEGIGKLTLTGNNSQFSGSVTIASNILQVGNGFTGNLGTGPITNNGSLNFNVSGSQTVPVNITGTGSITNIAGTVTLSGTNSYGGNTEVDGGVLKVGASTGISSASSLIIINNTNGASSVGTFDLNGNNATVAFLGNSNIDNGGLLPLSQGKIVNNGTTTNVLIINGGGTNFFYGNLLDNNNNGGITGPNHGAFGLVLIGGQLTLLAPWTGVGVSPFQAFSVNTFGGGVNGPGITISNATLVIGGSAISSSSDFNEGTKALGGNPSGTQNITMTGTNATMLEQGYLGSNGGNGQTTSAGILTVTTNTYATIYGPQRGTTTYSALVGSGYINYQTTYVRGQVGFGVTTNFYGTIFFGQNHDTSGGNLGLQGTGFPNANVVLGSTNTTGMLMGGANGGAVFDFGSLSGGDGSFTLGGGDQPASDGAASCVYAIGGLNQTNVVGAILNGTGEGIRKVGTGMLTFTNNIMSYAGQTVVSNGILAFAPQGNYGTFFGTLGFNPLTNNFLVGSNYTIVSPGVLDLTLVPSNTLYLVSRSRAQTLYGNGTLVGNLIVTNSIVAPGRRASQAGVYPSSLTVVSNAVFGTNSTIQMSFSTNTPVGYDNLNVLGSLTIQQASLVVFSNGAIPFASLTTNVFRFFSNSVAVNLGGFSGGITNISVQTNLPPGMFWRTNLDGTLAGYPTIPAGSMAIINTNNPVSVLLLQGLVVTPLGVLTPAFTSNTFSYTAVESYLHSPVTVTATNWDTTASNRVIYLGVTNGVASGVASGSLALNANPNSNNVVMIKVTGQDGVSVTNYTVTVIRHPDLTPGLLAPVQNGGSMTMSWPLSENGYQLQAQTNSLGIGLSTNWVVLTGSTLTNTYTAGIDSNNPSVFYRLINTNSP